jgi:hypothetical protein
MARYKATIEFSTLKKDAKGALQSDLEWSLDEYNAIISNVEPISLTAEEALKKIKDVVVERCDMGTREEINAILSKAI